MICTPAGHTVCSDVSSTSAFAHHYAQLGEPSPVDTADFDAEHMRYVQAQVAQYTVRSHDPGNAALLMQTLHLMPFRPETALQVLWRRCRTIRLDQRRALRMRC